MVAAGKEGAGLLCDQVTYEGSQQKLSFKKLNPIMVKGKSEPIQIYIPSERDTTEHAMDVSRENPDEDTTVRTRTVIGREEELKPLQDGIELLVSRMHRGGIVVYEGAAGIGKSTICNYAREVVSDVSAGYFRYFIQSLFGSADSVEKNTPFFMWKKILIELLYLDQYLGNASTTFPFESPATASSSSSSSPFGGSSHNKPGVGGAGSGGSSVPSDAWAAVNKECDKRMLEYMPLLNLVLPVNIPENATTKPMSAKQRQLHLHTLVKHLLTKRCMKRPVVLIFDNFQWADTASMDLAIDVAKEVESLLIVIGTRPFAEPFPPQYSGICTLPNAKVVQLTNMTAAECIGIVCLNNGLAHQNASDEQRLLPEAVEAEIAKAEGNPLFSQEIFSSLLQSGMVKIDDGKCIVVGDVSKVSIPSTVQGMIASRMDLLPAPHQMVLKVGMQLFRRCLFHSGLCMGADIGMQ
jgi:hypothetical protein